MWIYVLLRLFVRKPYTLEGDELRHLVTARNFYKLWNKSFYDMHPPFYSWLVKTLGASWQAGVVVSFLSSIGLYFIVSKVYLLLGLSPGQMTVALACLAFNYTLIYYSNRVFRYQLIALLGSGMIYCLLIHKFFIAGLLWGLLGLTCTFAGLRGFFIWGLLGCNWLTLVNFLVIYSSWLISKAAVYMTHEYYPSGIEGMIEKVRPFTLKQLFSPMYFPWIYAYYGKKELGYTFKGWFKRVGGIFGLYPPLTFLVPVALFFVIRGALHSPLWVSLLCIALLYPSLLKRYLPRNSIIAIPLLCYLMAKGLPPIPQNTVFWACFGAVVAFLCFNHTHILTKPKIKARITSRVLSKLTQECVLAEGLIAYPLAGHGLKVVHIPRDPDPINAINQVELSIDEFNLKYAVFSDSWKKEIYAGYPAIDYIKTFELIKTIKEDGENYYIYKL